MRYDRTEWRPRNSDGAFHGEVTARQALAKAENDWLELESLREEIEG